MREKLIIGIDPGSKTGFAAKNLTTGDWVEVATIKRWEIPVKILAYGEQYEIFVVFEDARKRKWFGKQEKQLYANRGNLSESQLKEYNGRTSGSGHVKGSCSMIEEFLKDTQIPYLAEKPKAGKTKIAANVAKRIYPGQTSEHSRDALMLIQGYNSRNLKLYFKAA